LYGPAKSKLIPKEELFLALKGGPAKGELERDFDILRLANAAYFVLKEQLRATEIRNYLQFIVRPRPPP
jgi:hypothetical protein